MHIQGLPASLDALPDHFAWLAQMRAEQPVYCDPETGRWHVFRHTDVERVLTDYAFFSSAQQSPEGTRSPFGDTMIGNDPPRHRQLRGLVSQAFTPRAVANLAPRIRTMAQELLDAVRPAGAMDVIGDLSYPLPVTVIAEMLGVPTADQEAFKQWSDAIVSVQLGAPDDPRTMAAYQRFGAAMAEMGAYFAELLAYRRSHPGDDLISGLLAAEAEGQHLTQEELIGFCILLLVAGNETTTNLIGNAIICFDVHPEAMARLHAQPDLMSGAIEEVLRYLPSVWDMGRRTTQEVEIGGQRIPADTPVTAWIASANRDGAQFPDADHFDIARKPNRHLSFGHGVHTCIGAPLARLEAAIVLPMMLAQLPELRRTREAPVAVIESGIVFGVKSLPVAFVPS